MRLGLGGLFSLIAAADNIRMTASTHPPLVQRLLEPAAYPHPTHGIRLVETHISWVFLTGPFAYKVKKPVDFGFLDFTTLERRRGFCEAEVQISGRFAPDIYLGTVPITGSADEPRMDGQGRPIEWAVKLVQFDEAERLDNLFTAGRLTTGECERLGAEIARVEESLAVADAASGWGTTAGVRAAVTTMGTRLCDARPDATERMTLLERWITRALAAAEPTITARIAGGRVRECHGDLHLANIVLHRGRMLAFDAIEFSPELRWIDVANDVAFLAMDLRARGRSDLAAHLVSGWMETANDHAAAAVLPIYEVYRAVVRAGVAALRGDRDGPSGSARAETDRYLDLAERLTHRERPRLFATCGVSGSGKTTLAADVIGGCNAVRLRSDVERKRLAGMQPTERPADAAHEQLLYGGAASRRVYERLATVARGLLGTGMSVVIDAACNRRWQREMLAAAARDCGAPLVWLDFDMPAETVLTRVAARAAAGADASDASIDVVRAQLAEREPITAAELVAAGAGEPPRRVWVTERELGDSGFVGRL
jgi:aminoglycoside phosphotransferase family enzyme/predicted kinase